MKKKSVAVFLILAMLIAAVFIAVSCDDTDANKDLTVSFDEETNCINWSASWATTFTVKIYDSNGNLIQNSALTKSTNSLQFDFPADVYKVEITAHGEGGFSLTKEIQITIIGSDEIDDGSSDETNQDVVTTDKDEPVKILSNTYYYLKTDEDDLSIGLVNTSGVKNVVAYELINETMWGYNEKRNTLLLKPYFLHRFSSGAVLKIEVEYFDGDKDSFDVQIVDVLPLQVIGGEDGLIEVDTASTALNYKIALGYDGEILKEGSYSIVKAICIDGKKRSSSDYLPSTTQAVISLYSSRVLSTLKSGLHYVEIYTTYGKSEVWLNVTNGKENIPCDVTIDYDSSYPNVFVTWDMFRQDAEYFIVDIGGKEYSSKAYPQLFDGNRFDATGKIAYGETATVKAIFDGVANYSELSKATLKVNIYSSFITKYLSYDNSFEFLGTTYNYYINDFDEFFDLIYYALMFYDKLDASSETGYEKKITFYPNSAAILNVDTSFKQVIDSLNEAVKYTKLTKQLENSGVYEINLKVESTFTPNASPDVTQMPIEQNKYQDTHYSASGRAADYEGFAVNSLQQEATVRLSEELYLALERGVRPVPVAGSSAYVIYEKAKETLRRIIDDSMTDYQKVHAIYDWLGDNVIYDWDITSKMAGISSSSSEYNKFYSYRQFYLEGVFIDGLAVCNGIAKAMSLLCGIEGIECYKIKGISSGGAHAWNKVKVNGNWYVVDATWANRKFTNSSSNTTREVLSHHTVFMSEAASGNKLGGAHYESFTGRYSGRYAGSEYNVFANTFFTYGSNLYDYVIESAEELEVLINYYKGKCATNQFITIDVSCNLTTLKTYLAAISVSDCYIELSDYNGAMSGVSSVIITKR